MEFFLLLSIQILLTAVPVMFLTKNICQTKVRAVFWFMALASLTAPVWYISTTANTLKGHFDFKLCGQLTNLSATPCSVFFLLLILTSGILYAFYEFQTKNDLKKYQMKNCIYTTLILCGALYALMLSNSMLSLLSLALTELFAAKLIISNNDNPKTQAVGFKFLSIMLISNLLLTTVLMPAAMISGSFNYYDYPNIFGRYGLIFYILILVGLSLPIIASLIYRIQLRETTIKNPVLGIFLPVIIFLTSMGLMCNFICLSAAPDKIWASLLSLAFFAGAIILGLLDLRQNNSTNTIYKDGKNILFLFGALHIGMTGALYKIPALAIAGILAFFVLILNYILAFLQTAIVLNEESEKSNFSLDLLKLSGNLSYEISPLTCGFLAPVLIITSSVLTIPAGSCNIFILLALLLVLAYEAISIIAINKIRRTTCLSFKGENKTQAGLKFFSGIFVTLTLTLGVFVTGAAQLCALPASLIINGKKYFNIYLMFINFTNYIQDFIVLFVIVLSIYFIIRKLKQQNNSCHKK